MTKERWEDIKTNIKQNFEIKDEYEQELDPGIAELIEFIGPKGRMLVSFSTKPKLLDKKTSFSNRAGSDVKVEKVYSESEMDSYFDAYTWSEPKDDWIKLDSEALF